MKTLKDMVEEVAREVEHEFQMGGLAEGLYLDFAYEVTKKVIFSLDKAALRVRKQDEVLIQFED